MRTPSRFLRGIALKKRLATKKVKGIDLKTIRISVYLFLFLLSGFTGLRIGSDAVRARRGQPEDTATQATTDFGSGNQHNLLFITVDDLENKHPRLTGVWLIAFYERSPDVDFLPIFPAASQETNAAATLAASFSLTEAGEPAPSFWRGLEQWDTWWEGYILLDETGLGGLREILTDSQEISAPAFASSWGNTLQAQRSFLERNCQLFSGPLGSLSLPSLSGGMEPHIRTNLNGTQTSQVWSVFQRHRENLTCQFPTLME